MNSTLQCLYSVPELRAALGGYSAQARSEYDGPHKLTVATRELFAEIGRSGSTVTPLRFLITLRQIFPQFAGQTNQGVFMQQDAEECWTRIMETLRTSIGGAGESASPVVQQLFGIDLETRLRSAETGEERLSTKTEYTLKCNITVAVNFLAQGFRLALDETREGMSELAGRNLVFSGTSALTRLPLYLTVQLMRFDYRQDTRERCKILKEVGFSATMDVLDFCSDALKAQLEEPRRRKQELSDKALGVRMQPAASGGGGAEEVMADAVPQVAPSVESRNPELQPTGLYELRALVTHKGRTADGGHYVSYVKQEDGSWMEFDDERPIPHTEEQILRLKGGQGDHPSAYLLLYRSILA
jgi:ubiquitin carboxyl-terminal hydrolase 14